MPIGTKSSWFASVGIEPMLAGIARVRDSATSEAAEIWTIMNPDESPGSAVRKAGSPWDRSGFTSRSTRRSAMAWSVVSAVARKSSACATGWPWKLPPEMTSPSWNTSGLSVDALSSTVDRVRGRSGSRPPRRRAPAARSGGNRRPGPSGRPPGATPGSRCRRGAGASGPRPRAGPGAAAPRGSADRAARACPAAPRGSSPPRPPPSATAPRRRAPAARAARSGPGCR